MTDRHDPLDDLASAHLDGQTTDAEAARIAADPDLVARVERLAAARAAVRGSDGPIDDVRRDTSIAAALAAFDELPAAPVTAIAARRRDRSSRRTLQLVGIAAAVILLALALPLLGRLDSGSDDTAATTFEATGKAIDPSRDASAGSGGAITTAARAAASPSDLGSFHDLPALADAVRAQVGAEASTPMLAGPTAAEDTAGTTPAATPPCSAQVEDADGRLLYVALADLDGEPVVVIVREAPDGTRTLTVLDRAGCTTVTTGRL
jgi:hypothetical protein